jgi:small subunit ribosomal protein S16
MAVKLRLRRMGAHKRPFYRVVVAESTSPRDGRFIETIGTYNPLTSPPTTTLDADKTRLWLSRGAQPTEAVERIMKWQGIVRDASPAPAASGPVSEPAEST